MASIYASKGGSDGSAYAQAGSSGGSVYSGGASETTTVKKKRGGILGSIENAAHTVESGVQTGLGKTADVTLSLGTGLYNLGDLEAQAIKHDVQHPDLGKHESLHDFIHGNNNPASKKLGKVEAQMGESSLKSATSPSYILHHPVTAVLNDLALVTGGAGVVARIGYAAKAAEAARIGETGELVQEGSEAAKAAQAAGHTVTPLSRNEKVDLIAKALSPTHEVPQPARLLGVPKLVAPTKDGKVLEGPAELKSTPVQIGTASRSALYRAAQSIHDSIAQKALDNGVTAAKQTRTARYAEGRVAGAVGESGRVARNVRNADVTKVTAAARDLDKGVPSRLGQVAMFLRSANVTGDEAARYWEGQAAKGIGDRVKIGRAVGQRQTTRLAKLAQAVHDKGLLKLDEGGNVTVDAAKYPKLSKADEAVQNAQATREGIIADRGLMTPEAMQERLDLVGRVMAGGKWEKPTPGKLGVPSKTLLLARTRVKRLEGLHERAIAKASEKAEPYGNIHTRTGYRKVEQTTAPEKALERQHVEVPAGPKTPGVPSDLPAKGLTTPTVERLGSALSVARDELARLEQAAQNRIEPTGIVGGEGARPGQGFVTLRTATKRSAGSPVARSQGSVIGLTKRLSLGKRATGRGVEKALIPVSTTTAVARGLHDALRFVNSDELRGNVAKLGSDVKRTGDDILIRDPAADKAGTISEHLQQILGRSESTVTEPGEDNLRLAGRKLLERAIPGLEDDFRANQAASIGERAPAGYKWVPKQLVPDDLTTSVQARGKVEKFADAVNSAVTSATVYLKLGHLPTRFLTNLSTNAVQGSLSPGELKKSVTLARDLTDAQKLDLASATGTHGYQALPHAGAGTIAKIATKGANAWAKHVDAPFRLNAVLYELRQVGIDSPAAIDKAVGQLKDPSRGGMSASEISKLDGAVRRANRASIMYDGLSAAEKRYVARYLWFFPWTKGAVRFAGHTVAEHPVKAAAIAAVGQRGSDYRNQVLGPVPPYELGLTPYTQGASPLAGTLSSFTPFSTVGDVAQLAAHPLNPDSGIIGQLNPYYGGVASLATAASGGEKHAVSNALHDVVQPTPEAQLLNAYLHPPDSGRMFGVTPTGVQDPRQAALLSALIRALGGAAVPRPVNKNVLNSHAG